jgi:hypothetical protein
MSAVDIVQKLWGTKHPEGRELTDSVYRELVQNLLIKESPEQITLKLPKKKLLPDSKIVQNARINPVLVKKNELNLPESIQRSSSFEKPILHRNSASSLIFNKIEK